MIEKHRNTWQRLITVLRYERGIIVSCQRIDFLWTLSLSRYARSPILRCLPAILGNLLRLQSDGMSHIFYTDEPECLNIIGYFAKEID